MFPDTKDPEYNDTMGWRSREVEEARENGHALSNRSAREIWHTIIESAWKSAEPGVVFMEYYNQMSNSWYFNPIICTNPCGEQGLAGMGRL